MIWIVLLLWFASGLLVVLDISPLIAFVLAVGALLLTSWHIKRALRAPRDPSRLSFPWALVIPTIAVVILLVLRVPGKEFYFGTFMVYAVLIYPYFFNKRLRGSE